jgi:hypothetical protein
MPYTLPTALHHRSSDLAAAGSAYRVTDFHRLRRNTLRGFVTVEDPSGLVLKEVAIHERDRVWWASPPARPVLVDGRHALDERGKGRWQSLIFFRSRTLQNKWSDAVVAAFREAFGDEL